MRDNSNGMIEFIDTFERDGSYFSIVGVPEGSSRARFQFGISKSGYLALSKILNSRPLIDIPGVKYRYFWDRSMGNKNESTISLGIRCEVENEGKSFDFQVPQDLASNLKWFSELKNLDDAKHLRLEIK